MTPITAFQSASDSFVRGAVLLQSGIGDKDVQRAETPDGLGDHALDLLLARHVRLEREGLAAVGPDRSDDRFGGFLPVAVVHGNACSGGRKSPFAMAAPMPELAPVTRAAWPRRSRVGEVPFASLPRDEDR